jgi:CBS domain-containing protein
MPRLPLPSGGDLVSPEGMMIRLSQILPKKRAALVHVAPTAPVAIAVGLMKQHRVGSVLILDPYGGLLGVLSERDVVHAFASDPMHLLNKTVLEIARTEVPTASPEDTVQSVMEVMTATRSRHVPVIQFGRVVGLVSIGDVVKSRIEEQTRENAVLQEIARAQYFAG